MILVNNDSFQMSHRRGDQHSSWKCRNTKSLEEGRSPTARHQDTHVPPAKNLNTWRYRLPLVLITTAVSYSMAMDADIANLRLLKLILLLEVSYQNWVWIV